jgi:hypothetical protein
MNRRFAFPISQHTSGTERVARVSQKNRLILRPVVRIKIPEVNSPMTMAIRSGKDSGRITLIEMLLFPFYIFLVVFCVQWGLHP